MNRDVPSLENRGPCRSAHTFARKINWNIKRGLHLDSEHLMTSDFPKAISPESQLCSDRGSLSYAGHPTKEALSGELLTLPRCDVCLSAHSIDVLLPILTDLTLQTSELQRAEPWLLRHASTSHIEKIHIKMRKIKNLVYKTTKNISLAYMKENHDGKTMSHKRTQGGACFHAKMK